jgi:serine phosphatase RsbU (regulator of sigma subunit)/PAS domain-containing protein
MPRELVLATGLVLGGLGYLALAWYVWRYRAAAGGRGLLAVLVSVFVWTTFYALELSSRTVPTALVWSSLKYFGVLGLPPSLLAYAVEYTGRRGLSRRALALLCVEPVLVLIALAIPGARELIRVYRPQDVAAAQLTHAPVAGPGPLFWPHAIYNYGLTCFALGLVVVRLARIGRPYRRSSWVVMAAALLPLVGNIAYNAGILGPDAMDPVPFLFTLVAVVLVWGFFRLRLLDLVPVARGLVLEQMVDAALVLDAYDRVVDANPAAARMLRVPSAGLVGHYLADLLPPVAPLLEHQSETGDPARWDARIPGPGTGPDREVSVTVTTLVDRRAAAGRLVMLHDVTERQAAQRRLHDLLAEQTRVADTLQAGLRPASLPEVDGVRMAVRSLPAGTGDLVSGDFYDVHRVLGGDWAFVLGDVSGKGVEAAVVTSMARWTVRTLSAEGRTPVQVLEQLNRALITDDVSERFATLVYGRIDAADLLTTSLHEDSPALDGAGTVNVSLVLGGHPRPLLRRRDGEVCPVGVPGTVLGLLPKVDVEEVGLTLGSGDVLLAYTDGVTEARRDGEQFGEERLARVLAAAAVGLRGRTGLTAAGLVAEAIAERVLTEVTEWATVRDDIAVFVLAVP